MRATFGHSVSKNNTIQYNTIQYNANKQSINQSINQFVQIYKTLGRTPREDATSTYSCRKNNVLGSKKTTNENT